MTAFSLGIEARCTDGVCGHVVQVVLDPLDTTLTHLIVEPEHRRGQGRLVPIDLVTPEPDHVDLRCTKDDFDRLEVVEAVRFLQGIEGYTGSGYDPDEVLLWPYYERKAQVPLVVATLPGPISICGSDERRSRPIGLGVRKSSAVPATLVNSPVGT